MNGIAGVYRNRLLHFGWSCKLCTWFFGTSAGESFEYRTINSQSSTISGYHHAIERVGVSKHLQLCALMHGVFNKKPPQPKFC